MLKLRSQSILYSFIGCLGGVDQLAPGFYSLVAKLKLKTCQIVYVTCQ